jgi:hypothetical protein
MNFFAKKQFDGKASIPSITVGVPYQIYGTPTVMEGMSPLLGPEGWRQWTIFVQPVKQISGFDAVRQLGRHV